MIRRSVDLPQPEGPINETNSPGWIARSMPSRATVRPPEVSKTLSTPATLTTGLPLGSLTTTSRCQGRGPATEHDELRNPNHEEEAQPEQRRREDRGP